MNPIHRLMRQAVDDGVFPGGVLLAARDNDIRCFVAAGCANLFTGTPVEKDTVFDLASLTKPLATTLAVIKLVEQGLLDIDQKLGSILPVFQVTDKSAVTVRQLLAHRSGLPDYQPYYMTLRNVPSAERVATLRQLLVREPLIHPVGVCTVYSDIGFMILEWIVECLSGRRLDHFVEEGIYRPLGLDRLFFIDLGRPRPEAAFAATEHCPWRHRVLEGEVHDDNASCMGGVAGHAGLFGTAEHVFGLLAHLMSIYNGAIRSGVVCREQLHVFFERQPGSDRALGFDMPSETDSSSGELFSGKSVGHLGFTGTSFWMDLEQSVTVILLTNRVHPSRENVRIKAFRPLVHNAVMELLTGGRC